MDGREERENLVLLKCPRRDKNSPCVFCDLHHECDGRQRSPTRRSQHSRRPDDNKGGLVCDAEGREAGHNVPHQSPEEQRRRKQAADQAAAHTDLKEGGLCQEWIRKERYIVDITLRVNIVDRTLRD